MRSLLGIEEEREKVYFLCYFTSNLQKLSGMVLIIMRAC